jgi:hypothetical protein
MVRGIALLFLLFYAFSIAAQDITVEASINPSQTQNNPLSGTITITHPRSSLVDPGSFKMEAKSLNAAFVKQVQFSKQSSADDLIISIYHFELPAQSKGLYVLPSISVKIGDAVYHSYPTTYEVKEAGKTASSIQTAVRTKNDPKTGTPTLYLEAFVKGPTPVFPGQRMQLVYRIWYNRDIDLSVSSLPFLYVKELKKIGDEQIRDFQEGDFTVQEIIQEVEASQPGTFRLGPSVIEGYMYEMDEKGQKIYQTDPLRSEAPVQEIVVSPFPIENQPASFNGAIGKLNIQLTKPSSTTVLIREIIKLPIAISGASNLEDLHLPDLACQPGFSGFFAISDLPPPGQIEGQIKYFNVELAPLSSLTTAIPSLEISSFDPATQQYVIWRSTPIPLTVKAFPKQEKDKKMSQSEQEIDIAALWKNSEDQVDRIDLEAVYLSASDFDRSFIQTAAILWLIPFGALLLLLQLRLQNMWTAYQQKRKNRPMAPQLLKHALKEKDPQKALKALQQAFLTQIQEGRAPNPTLQQFLESIDAGLYGQNKDFLLEDMKKKAHVLFQEP